VEGGIGLEEEACGWQGGYGRQNHFCSGFGLLFPLLRAESVNEIEIGL